MNDVTANTSVTASEIRNRVARAKVAGQAAETGKRINLYQTPEYKAEYARLKREEGKQAAHNRYKIAGAAKKLARQSFQKSTAAKTAKAAGATQTAVTE